MSYDSTILAEAGLLAYWPLNDTGATAADATGNGHTLTLASGISTGTHSLLSGDSETAMTWGNTVAAESSVASPAAFSITTLSVEYWVKHAALASGNVHTFSVHGTGGFGAGYKGGVGWLFTTYGHADTTFTSIPTVDIASHVVFTLDGSGNLKLYLNGTLSQTITGVAISAVSGAIASTIGGRSSDSGFIDGVLQKVALYNVALTSTQVANHFNTGTVTPGGAAVSDAAVGAAAVSDSAVS